MGGACLCACCEHEAPSSNCEHAYESSPTIDEVVETVTSSREMGVAASAKFRQGVFNTSFLCSAMIGVPSSWASVERFRIKVLHKRWPCQRVIPDAATAKSPNAI